MKMVEDSSDGKSLQHDKSLQDLYPASLSGDREP